MNSHHMPPSFVFSLAYLVRENEEKSVHLTIELIQRVMNSKNTDNQRTQ
jgi:lipopolysaccharide biosynthesis regulator YciM